MFKLFFNGIPVGITTWKFPAGEVGVKINQDYTGLEAYPTAKIVWEWEGNDDVMLLVQLVDAVRANNVQEIILDVPYFPYSRQDRRCNKGEGHALRGLANIVNSLGFKHVYTQDAHSYVLEALIPNLVNIPQHVCAKHLPHHDVLIAPDNGASKKIYQFSRWSKVIVASKTRNTQGVITETQIDLSGVGSGREVYNETICVVDDLCDGGATFIELGKVIRATHKSVVNLYVTHGLFTKGVDTLLELYNTVYVHNLVNKDVAHLVKII